MEKFFIAVLVLILAIIAIVVAITYFCTDDWCYIFPWQRTTMEEIQVFSNDRLKIVNPLKNALIQTPLNIIGEARGSWFFEASFPIRLTDGNGNEIARINAQATKDWMMADFVPFGARLVFLKPETKTGNLIFANDNPSGIPDKKEEIYLPVRFK